MEGFCRSCLIKFQEPTDLIPYTEKNRRLFVYSTGLQVKRNDSFPFQLCKECYLNMKVACNFKKTSRNSDKKFKNYLANKEAGENGDFCSFLKNNDETLKFRLPMDIGNSSPAKITKDDDNESTCTSIQNFMRDIFHADEIPDSEARIIREVIEEEADILEESLDSHWLQDDVSVDTEFRLDFSFSPFSTPPSTNDNYIPKALNDTKSADDDITIIKIKPEVNNVSNTLLKTNIKPPDDVIKEHIVIETEKCAIDVNLENALKNDSSQKFMLDELLATPPVLPNVTMPPTPLITNILFGDKIDIENATTQNKHVYVPRKEMKEDIDVIDEFLKTNQENSPNNIINLMDIDNNKNIDLNVNKIDNMGKFESELNILEENNMDEKENNLNRSLSNINEIESTVNRPLSPVENKYCIEKLYCKLCDRNFKSLVALKVHTMKRHKIKIEKPKTKRIRPKMICDYCGRSFTSSRFLVPHIRNHERPNNPYNYQCEHCPLSFQSETLLTAHRVTHGIQAKKDKNKQYVCNLCGAVSYTSANYHVHMRRHNKKYIISCQVCDRGFFRKSDWVTHVRRHTGERPYECQFCPAKFSRHDSLNRHTKCHTGEKPFACQFCDAKFGQKHTLKTHQKTNKSCLRKRILLPEDDSILNFDIEMDLTGEYTNGRNNDCKDQEILCAYCNSIFTNIEELQTHQSENSCLEKQMLLLEEASNLNGLNTIYEEIG